ncbi:hypothetical protein [Actinomycetospora sp. TBRC 11914]|uniref:hypothetical protein n=1 Tax=Actinomycetospora sp. TBRC 11914 TaxID=2729387 RepID=UPI00145F1EAE|nr:hypothetical protein [Actinomycetospora sp. TBRC 11914]NMO92802.1 hypothetical protein [Actinomycetospora sp. TBRC 11914]
MSVHTAMNLGGPPAVVAYAMAAGVVALLLPPAIGLLERTPSWVLPAVAVACLATLTVVFVVGVPRSADLVLGVGSDRANALDVALGELAAGRYPYTATTYLGNPITPLPGALLLAAPFRFLAGTAAWQNVVWTALLLPLLNGGWRLRAGPTLLWLLTVAGGLEVWREFLVGDDLVSGAVPALAAVIWTLRAARPDDGGSVRVLTAAAVALGVTTCTRPHLALVVVIVAAAVGLRAGRNRGLLVGGVAATAWVVLIVPFLLGGSARFSPLHVAAKVTDERGLSPAIVAIALVAAVLLGAALWRVRPTSDIAVGWFCAAVLAAPSLLSLARALFETGAVWGADLTLGAVAVPFAAWAVVAGVPVPSTAPRGEDPVPLAA